MGSVRDHQLSPRHLPSLCALLWLLEDEKQQKKKKSKFEHSTHTFLGDFDHNFNLSKIANYLYDPPPTPQLPKLAPPPDFMTPCPPTSCSLHLA